MKAAFTVAMFVFLFAGLILDEIEERAARTRKARRRFHMARIACVAAYAVSVVGTLICAWGEA